MDTITIIIGYHSIVEKEYVLDITKKHFIDELQISFENGKLVIATKNPLEKIAYVKQKDE